METEIGQWTAGKEHAEIDDRHSRSGSQCLHVLGGEDRMVQLEIDAHAKAAGLIFHAERWTRRTPFEFRVEAMSGSDDRWTEIYNGDQDVQIGRFSTRVAVALPPDTSQLRFRCTSPSRSGLLMDDVAIVDAQTLRQSEPQPVGTQDVSKRQKPLGFARPFSDHMVLQSHAELPVWGYAQPESRVLVQLGREQLETVANINGEWQVRFNPRLSTSEPVELVATVGADRKVIRDVLVGQVWFCAGQSNMEWTLQKSAGGAEALATLDNPSIRLLHLQAAAKGSSGRYTAEQINRLVPEKFSEGRWKLATSESARDFSAVAWYFGQRLQRQSKQPIGLICAAVGGTPTEAWISRQALEADPALKGIVAGNWLENEQLGDFCRERGSFNLSRAIESDTRIPGDKLGPNHSFKPGFMWEASVKPVVPFAIAGVIWYQGESNAETLFRVSQHQQLFPTLVSQWRRDWSRPKLPFAFVQLPALNRPFWPLFRDQQRRMLDQIDHSSMAITIDTGHPTNVHPKEKRVVGERLATLAQELTRPRFSEPLHPASGPLLDTVSPEGRGLVVKFRSNVGGLQSSDGGPLRHFEVASQQGEFVPAVAKLQGDKRIRVSSPKVEDPQHVRYAWKPFPTPGVNLVDAQGLPASPFSTRPQSNRPNVLLIVGEDHGCELSCYGDPVIETPNIDRLAAEGMLFENGYVTQSVCSPSRSTLFTGLYPHQNGQLGLATHQFRWFHPWPTTYSMLKRSGYRTGLIGKTHVLPEKAVESFVDFRFQKSSNFAKKKVSDYAVQAGKFFDESDDPFFMTVNYPDAHWPLQGKVEGLPTQQVDAEKVKVMSYVGSENERMRKVVQNYYDCMLRLDACVGQLLSELQRSGKADNTLVVFVGDHGAQMARGKVTVYEGGMRVPLIARWPGKIEAGQRTKTLASTIDLLPTFMEAANVASPEGLPGKSLLPVLEGDVEEEFREYLFCERNCDAAHLTFPQRTVRDGRYKLIHTLVQDREDPAARYYRVHGASHWSGSLTDQELEKADDRTRDGYARWLHPPEYQLYDLSLDPDEWHDLSEDPMHAATKQRLSKALQEWQVETDDPLRDPQKLKRLMQETDELNRKQLRSPPAGWQYLQYLRPASLPASETPAQAKTVPKHTSGDSSADAASDSPSEAENLIPSERLPLTRSQPLFVSGTEETHTFRIPAIATATNGDLIAACDARRKGSADLIHQREIDIVFRRSNDGGRTWTNMQTLDSVDDGGCSDPSLLVDRVTGDVFCFYNYMVRDKSSKEFRFYVQRSSDHGATWGPAIDFTDQVATPDLKQSFKFVTSGRGIQTRDGTLLHNFVRVGKGATLFASGDHGETWHATGEVSPGDESKVLQLDDGAWMVNSRVAPGKRFVHRSSDQGATWTSVEFALPDPRCNASILQYTSKSDGFAKNRLLFCNAASNRGRKNLAVRISYDDGRTWSKSKVIDPGPSAYSELTVLTDGSIGVLYEPGYKEVRFVRFTLEDLTDGDDRLNRSYKPAAVSGKSPSALEAGR
ncbi:MAG: sulfatase-like hydrolase/transferase [Rubripirellula sp.]